MNINKNKVVTIDYLLADEEGTVIAGSSGNEPLTYIHGRDNILPILEEKLEGKAPGDTVTAIVPPEKGYGVWKEKFTRVVPRKRFEKHQELHVGTMYRARTKDGRREIVRVVGINGDKVTVDANHPLADMTLSFMITVKEVREATAKERKRGRVKGRGSNRNLELAPAQ